MGSQYERDLVCALNATGYAAMRCPASGSATDRPLPDVLAGEPVPIPGRDDGPFARPLAIELKATKATTAYADAAEVESLEDFARTFGARPVLAARFKRPGGARSPFWFVDPSDCRMTQSGNYGVPEADVADRALAALYPATDAEDARLTWH